MESAIHGRPGICQSNSDVRGYSDMGGYSSDYPWRVSIYGRSGDCQCNSGVRGYSEIGGVSSGNSWRVAIHGEWYSTYGPGSVKVTTVFGDTLT